MTTIISILSALLLTINAVSVTVDRIETGDNGNYAVIEIATQEALHYVDINTEDLNTTVESGEKLDYSSAVGTFEEGKINNCDNNTYYQFKSYDNSVWWCLMSSEIGFVPEAGKTYIIYFFDNNTKDCYTCDPKYNCECEVYDDIFLLCCEA